MDVIESLENFGLSKKESKVYLACLELDDSLASDISLKSNLPRTLIYDLLERLIDLGIVSYAIKNNRKYFRAAHPQELIRILKEKEKTLQEVLPQLEKLHDVKGTNRPKVGVYEGIEGMKTIMEDILRSNTKEFFAYGSSRSSFELIPGFILDWHKRRIKNKIFFRVLYNNTKESREKIKKYPVTLKYAEYRLMPIELESPTAVLIYADKVVFTSWTKDPFGVMIENNEMSKNQKNYFQELWKIALKN